MTACPKCGSSQTYRDGIRYTDRGEIQRWLCNGCGYRFSLGNPYKECQTIGKRQVCAILQEAKNLDTATETKTVAGDGKTQQEIEVKIVQYAIVLQNKGKTPETIRTYVGSLYTLAHKGADLLNPQQVEEVIAKQENWSIRAKRNYTDWYARFVKFLHIEWEKPNYKAPDKIPFFPLETEIDQLIART